MSHASPSKKELSYFDEAPSSIHVLPMSGDNYSCVVEGEKSLIAFDPKEADTLLRFAEKLQKPLSAVIVTHHHRDHTAGLGDIKKSLPNLPLIGPKGSHEDLNRFVEHHELMRFDDDPLLHVRCLYVGAHTQDHFIYALTHQNAIIAGDFLFPSGCGFDFEGGALPIFSGLGQLRSLPGETWVYSGHEYGLKNAAFSLHYDNDNPAYQKRFDLFKKRREQGLPTIPTKLSLEFKLNLFYNCNSDLLQKKLQLRNQDPYDCFCALLKAKKAFSYPSY